MNVIRVHENIIRTSSEYHLNMTRIISENHPNIIRRRSEHHQDMIWISSKCPLNVIRRPSGYTLRISSEYNPNKIWKSSEYHLNIIRCAKKVGQEGRKVGSLKRRVRSHLLRWEMKNCTPLWHETHFQVKMCKVPGVWNTFGSCDVEICTPLWREAHFEVKKYKTLGVRTTFGSWDVEKVHAVVARSTFRSQNAQNTRGSDHFLEVEMSKKCTPLWREAHFEVKKYKTPGVRTTFGSCVEKVHAVVARSTFRSQNVQNTRVSDHFWKLRCRKSARRCGTKHISKSKCTKHTSSGPLLEVETSKKCTPLWREAHFEVKMYKTHQVRTTFGSWDVEKCMPLWREAHFQVKMYKTHHSRTTFGSWDVEKVHAVVARSTFPSQNVQNTPFSDHFWKLRCRKSARRCGAKHISKSECTKHKGFGLLLDVQMSFRVAGARDCAPSQKWAKREGFVAFPKTMAGVGHLKKICKDAFSVAGALQKTCSSEMLGGPGADFLRQVAFWSIRSSVLGRWFCVQVQHFVWPGLTFSWQAQYFRQVEWKNRKTHWYEAVSSALNFPFLKEVSQNSFVFDVVKQNYFVFDVVNFEK